MGCCRSRSINLCNWPTADAAPTARDKPCEPFTFQRLAGHFDPLRPSEPITASPTCPRRQQAGLQLVLDGLSGERRIPENFVGVHQPYGHEILGFSKLLEQGRGSVEAAPAQHDNHGRGGDRVLELMTAPGERGAALCTRVFQARPSLLRAGSRRGSGDVAIYGKLNRQIARTHQASRATHTKCTFHPEPDAKPLSRPLTTLNQLSVNGQRAHIGPTPIAHQRRPPVTTSTCRARQLRVRRSASGSHPVAQPIGSPSARRHPLRKVGKKSCRSKTATAAGCPDRR